MLGEMGVKKILLCEVYEDREMLYIESVSGEVEEKRRYYLPELLKMMGISSYDEAIKRGILKVVSSTDHEYLELRERYANLHIRHFSYNIRYNLVLEKYLMLKNNKSLIPEPIIPLFEEFEEILLSSLDNLNEFLDNFNNIDSFIHSVGTYVFSYRSWMRGNVDYPKKTLEELKKKVADIDKKKSALQKESFRSELSEYFEEFLSIRSSYSGTNSKLNALIDEQYKNMKYYSDNPDLITENGLEILSFCNSSLRFTLRLMKEGKRFEYGLFRYETNCKILKNEVNGAITIVENIKKIKNSLGKKMTSESRESAPKPIERREVPKSNPVVARTESRVSRPESTFEMKKEESKKLKETPFDITEFLSETKKFKRVFFPVLDERYQQVLQSILDSESYYYSHQELINESIFSIMKGIHEDFLKIEEEYAKNKTIHTFKLVSLEGLAIKLRSTLPKEEKKAEPRETKNTTFDIADIFLKFKNLRYRIVPKLDDEYKDILQNIYNNEGFFYLRQDLVDEQVFSIIKEIYNICIEISLALEKGQDVYRYRRALAQLDINLKIVTNRKRGNIEPTHEVSSGKKL